MKTTTTKYDVADHLRNQEEIAAYLTASIEDEYANSVSVAKALDAAVKSNGTRIISTHRENLDQASSGLNELKFTTFLEVVKALGFDLRVEE